MSKLIKGDWVRVDGGTPHQFKKDDWVRHRTTNKILYLDDGNNNVNNLCASGGYAYDASNLEPWKPQVGEWCWFWDWDRAIPHLDQFECMRRELLKPKNGAPWKYCEPFIGDLPTNLIKIKEEK